MTLPVQQILDKYLLKVEEITFYKRTKRLELSLVSDKLIEPKTKEKIENDLLANIPKVSALCLNIKCKDAEKAIFEDISEAQTILKECAKELNPQCTPIIDCSVWEVDRACNKVLIRVPTRYERLMPAPVKELFTALGLNVRFEIVGDDNISVNADNTCVYAAQKNEKTAAPAVPVIPKKPKKEASDTRIIFGSAIPDDAKITPMIELKRMAAELRKQSTDSDKIPGTRVTVCGSIVPLTEEEEKRKEQNLDKLRRVIADDTSAVQLICFKLEKDKRFANQRIEEAEKAGLQLIVRGRLTISRNSDEYYIIPYDINTKEKEYRQDTSEKKRVELHLHTRMSEMDALTKVSDVIKTAARWGHRAIAITDHGVVHSFPEAMEAAKKNGIKLIYGVEGYLQNDCELLHDFDIDYVTIDGEKRSLVSVSLVCFNVLSEKHFAEIKAVRHATGERFSTLINSGAPIPARFPIKYDPESIASAPHTEQAIHDFVKFLGDSIPVCHDSQDYLALQATAKRYGAELTKHHIDTQLLTHYIFPEAKSISQLQNACKEFDNQEQGDSAELTMRLYAKICEHLRESNSTLPLMFGEVQKNTKKKRNYYHIILLAKNREGLKNLYKLISYAHLENFSFEPLMPKSLFSILRNGIILGSACERGEVFRAVLENKPEAEQRKIASWYDYLEIQPIGNNAFMLKNGTVQCEDDLRALNKRVVELGEALNKPVVATGDVHFLEPEDYIYRAILMHSKHFKDANEQPPLYFKTTCEMLKEFSYLGEEKAMEIVVDNPNAIADSCEPLTAYLDDKPTYSPVFENASEELYSMAMTQAHKLYGENLPKIVEDRLKFELDSIINNGYATLYISAVRLVKKSMDDGYLVGSRGSVGSSFVAYLAGITEVNPLSAHYLCPNCTNSEFNQKYSCGADMPDKTCECGTPYKKLGFEIPFETFLGFKGDKTPDIDLNFSGEYHASAHEFTREMFGETHAIRAGIISTLKDKTAYGFVLKYCEDNGLDLTPAEISKLVMGCVGVKRTTGQHPGGMVIVPKEFECADFFPLQYPANKKEGNKPITHFDFHAMNDKLVKLDVLGHVDPTALKMLHDLTGLNPQDIPLDDEKTLSLFSSPEALGVNLDAINCDSGVLGIPEYGTTFVRGILSETKPKTIEELVCIAGLSHGTNVWSGNAQDLIKQKKAVLSEVIGTRDDIMRYLIAKGCEPKMAFSVMESVRKGKGLTEEMEEVLRGLPLPSWYIDSCKKIKYMFPRAHAAAYLTMAFRVAYYKVHYPAEFYAVYFTARADDFDIALCSGNAKTVLKNLRQIEKEIKEQGGKRSRKAYDEDDYYNEDVEEEGTTQTVDKLKKLIPILEVVYEMNLRGIRLLNVDINKSDATNFIVVDKSSLLPPFNSIQGLGKNMAMQIVEARKKRKNVPYENIQDFKEEAKVSTAIITKLTDLGCFEGMAESSQITLF